MVNLRKGVNLKKVSKQKYTFTCTISKLKLVKNKQVLKPMDSICWLSLWKGEDGYEYDYEITDEV